jgi:hypothetical protein
MVDLAEIGLILQTISVMSAATAAVIGVRSYINSNKRAEEAKRKEQETREMELKAQQQNLETRQAQLFMGVYQTSYTYEQMNAQNIVFKLKLKDANDYEILGQDSERYNAFYSVAMWLEGLGVLVREGLIEIRLVSELSSGYIQWWWSTFGAFVINVRRERSFPRYCVEIEYLANQVREYGVKHPELGIVESPNMG